MTSSNVVGALDHVALNENRNAVCIWSAAICFIFVAPINVIFMRPLYKADVQCDCIIDSFTMCMLSVIIQELFVFPKVLYNILLQRFHK